MKNILATLICLTLLSCGSSGGAWEEAVQPDYTRDKQQLPLKLENGAKCVNSKDFTAAKSISVSNGGIWNRAKDAEDLINSNKQMTYDFKNYKLDANTFSPDRGPLPVKGKVVITQSSLKIVVEKDFTAAFYCSKDPLALVNWSLDHLIVI